MQWLVDGFNNTKLWINWFNRIIESFKIGVTEDKKTPLDSPLITAKAPKIFSYPDGGTWIHCQLDRFQENGKAHICTRKHGTT